MTGGGGEAAGDYGWIAPTYGVADRGVEAFRQIAPDFARVVGRMPTRVEFEGAKGPCRVFFLSADNPDSIRGFGFRGVVVDEAASQDVKVWNYVVRPTLAQTMGWGVFIGPPNTTEAKEALYYEVAKAIGKDGRGYLPNGSDVKYVDGGGNGKPPFRDHLDYVDRQIVLVGTGGLLTMLTESGSGTLAGSAHQQAFDQVAKADCPESSIFVQNYWVDCFHPPRIIGVNHWNRNVSGLSYGMLV